MIIKKNILIWYWGRHGFAQKYTNQIIKELLIINKKKNYITFIILIRIMQNYLLYTIK